MKLKRRYSYVEFGFLILGLVFTVVAFILFAGNTANPDYQNYLRMYNEGTITVEDGLLKSILSYCFMKIGVPYQVFFGVLAVICIILIWKTVNYYAEGNSFAFLLYLIYPFFLDIVQIDNTLAYVIVLYALRYLEYDDYKKGILRYVCLILVATMMHPIAIIYIVFILKYIQNERKLTIIVAAIYLGLFSLSTVLPLILSFIPVLNRFSTQLGYYTSWVSEYNLNLKNGVYLYTAIFLVCYLFSRYKYKEQCNYGLSNNKTDTIIRLFLIIICLVPLINVSSEFTRVVRNIWILYYCYWLNNKFYKKKIYYIVGAIMLSIFLFYRDLGPNAYYFERVTQPIFQNNLFF